MKKICTTLCLALFMMIIIGNKTYAAEKDGFFEEFYSKEYSVYVEDKEKRDVTEKFLNQTEMLYQQDDIDSIKDIMKTEKLTAHIYKEQEQGISLYALEQFKTVSDVFLEYYSDDTYGTVMEFYAELTGGMWYDPNTYEVKRTSSPTLKINAMNVPTKITPFCNEIKTGSSVVSGKGYFWAEFVVSGQSPSYELLYNYGKRRLSFYATP